jgi:hypothetical protein
MAGLGADSAASAGFQVKPHRLIQLAPEKIEQIVSSFLIHFLASSQFIHGQRQKRMHALAERKKQ